MDNEGDKMNPPKTYMIGIDLDTHDGYTFTITKLNAMKFGKVTTDYTRKGFHIKIELTEPIPLDKALEIRRLLKDDPVRIEYDEAKLLYGNYTGFDTLFDWKNGNLNYSFIMR